MDFENSVAPKIQILQQAGASRYVIVYYLINKHKELAGISDVRFEECVDRAKKMGSSPGKRGFINAVYVMARTPESVWDKRVEFYKKCGWSDEDVCEAFKRRPWCMWTKGSKITEVFDLLVGKFGYDASSFARHPWMIALSTEKTISPRSSVFHVLLEKEPTPMKWLDGEEKEFLKNFVTPFSKEAPELLRLYPGKKGSINEHHQQNYPDCGTNFVPL